MTVCLAMQVVREAMTAQDKNSPRLDYLCCTPCAFNVHMQAVAGMDMAWENPNKMGPMAATSVKWRPLALAHDHMHAMQAVAETMMARDGKSPQLRLLVPTPLCGSIIGKGGATIRSFAEDSQAAITVSPQVRPMRASMNC